MRVQPNPRRSHRSHANPPHVLAQHDAARPARPHPVRRSIDDHLRRIEVHVGDGDPGQAHQTLECCGDAHGFGLLGSVGFAAPNLRTARARHADAVARTLAARPPTRPARRVPISGRSATPKTAVLHGETTPHPARPPTFMPEDPKNAHREAFLALRSRNCRAVVGDIARPRRHGTAAAGIPSAFSFCLAGCL